MPRKKIKNIRSLEQIFSQAKQIGAENVLLNDGELGAVLAGDTATLSPATIANWRSSGQLNLRHLKAGREPRYRLSDAVTYRDKCFRM